MNDWIDWRHGNGTAVRHCCYLPELSLCDRQSPCDSAIADLIGPIAQGASLNCASPPSIVERGVNLASNQGYIPNNINGLNQTNVKFAGEKNGAPAHLPGGAGRHPTSLFAGQSHPANTPPASDGTGAARTVARPAGTAAEPGHRPHPLSPTADDLIAVVLRDTDFIGDLASDLATIEAQAANVCDLAADYIFEDTGISVPLSVIVAARTELVRQTHDMLADRADYAADLHRERVMSGDEDADGNWLEYPLYRKA